MTTLASPTSTTSPASPAATGSSTAQQGVTWPRAMRSEWIKFWSVRSTVWTLLSAVLVIPFIGMMISAVITGDVTPKAGQGGGGSRFGGGSPLDLSLAAVDFGVLIVGVLDNGLLLANVSAYIQLVMKGCILAAAVIYDTMSKASGDRVKRMKAIGAEN